MDESDERTEPVLLCRQAKVWVVSSEPEYREVCMWEKAGRWCSHTSVPAPGSAQPFLHLQIVATPWYLALPTPTFPCSCLAWQEMVLNLRSPYLSLLGTGITSVHH